MHLHYTLPFKNLKGQYTKQNTYVKGAVHRTKYICCLKQETLTIVSNLENKLGSLILIFKYVNWFMWVLIFFAYWFLFWRKFNSDIKRHWPESKKVGFFFYLFFSNIFGVIWRFSYWILKNWNPVYLVKLVGNFSQNPGNSFNKQRKLPG